MEDLFQNLLEKLADVDASADVDWYNVELGDADDYTGQFEVTRTEHQVKQVLIFSKAAQQMLLGTGVYVRLDAVGLTKDTDIEEGDHLEDDEGVRYIVMSKLPQKVGDKLIFNVLDLTVQRIVI